MSDLSSLPGGIITFTETSTGGYIQFTTNNISDLGTYDVLVTGTINGMYSLSFQLLINA